MVEIETQYNLFTSDGDKIAEIKSDKDGLGMIQMDIGVFCGEGHFCLDPDDAIAVANAILRKAKDIKEESNV